MSKLPDHYLSPQDLPFNHSALAGRFHFETPDRDPGGAGLWLLLQGSRLLLGQDRKLPPGEERPLACGDAIYIGRWEGLPLRLCSVEREMPLPDRLCAHDLGAQEPDLGIDLLSLGALGRHLLHWEKGSRHCSRCGGILVRLPHVWGKECHSCGVQHFPHIHPCIIVLVRRPGEVLLTRKAEWPPGRYSLVAGFVDFGECLEETVAREVREETGVEVVNVQYVGSQAWPFPSQVMCGFVADYVGGEVRVGEDELEDARWFRLDALPKLPPKRSIARFILDRYLGGEPA